MGWTSKCVWSFFINVLGWILLLLIDKCGLSLHVWKVSRPQKEMSFTGMKVMKSDRARRSLTDMCTVLRVPKSSHLPRSPIRHSDSRSFQMKVSIMEHNEPMICSLIPRNFAWQRSSSSSRELTLRLGLDSSSALRYQKDGISLGLSSLVDKSPCVTTGESVKSALHSQELASTQNRQSSVQRATLDQTPGCGSYYALATRMQLL